MILVTGASGFTGMHLVRALAEEALPVRALYNTKKPTEAALALPNISWMACDLLDVFAVEEAMEGITKVYHCAAMVSFAPADRELMLHNNIEGTANLVNAALDAGVERLIHLSSIAALGKPRKEAELISEDNIWEEDESATASAYAISKYESEMQVWRAAAEGLNLAILNPGIILGAGGDWTKGSSKLMGIVADEFPWYTSGITAFVDVRDVVKAALLLMQSKVVNERYVLSAGNFSYKEVFTAMANAMGVKPPHRKANSWMTAIVWRISSIKSKISGSTPTITKETAKAAQTVRRFDTSKWLAAFPKFEFSTLKETVEVMAVAYKKEVIDQK